jgi:hypothetical protein
MKVVAISRLGGCDFYMVNNNKKSQGKIVFGINIVYK